MAARAAVVLPASSGYTRACRKCQDFIMQNFLFIFTAVTVAAFIAAGIYFLIGAIKEGREERERNRINH
jgi:hypothetical protein